MGNLLRGISSGPNNSNSIPQGKCMSFERLDGRATLGQYRSTRGRDMLQNAMNQILKHYSSGENLFKRLADKVNLSKEANK
jgi:hypothetical protein